MKIFRLGLMFGGAILIFLALLFGGSGSGGDKLPDWCAGIANVLDRGEANAENANQISASLRGANIGDLDNTRGLTHSHDTATHRIYNVHSDCGSALTMADRAHSQHLLKFQTWPVGLIGVLVFALSFLGKSKKGGLQTAYA